MSDDLKRWIVIGNYSMRSVIFAGAALIATHGGNEWPWFPLAGVVTSLTDMDDKHRP